MRFERNDRLGRVEDEEEVDNHLQRQKRDADPDGQNEGEQGVGRSRMTSDEIRTLQDIVAIATNRTDKKAVEVKAR